MEFNKINLGVKNWQGEEFNVSKFFAGTDFTNEVTTSLKGNKLDFYLLSEIKGTLDIEGEGSSRKIIKDLISGKIRATNENEHKAINLYHAMEYIKKAKPEMNKDNLMMIYKMLTLNIDMGSNTLEDTYDYRQSKEEGFIGKFKTPSIEVMEKGMEDLFKFINSDTLEYAKIEKSILIQIMFIYFHPFYDFNGRTGRLMTFWYLNSHEAEDISNSVYLALPENKKKYIKMWEALRKNKWDDLTTFLNFIGSVTRYGVEKYLSINKQMSRKGISLNDTEKIILFYLMDTKGWTLGMDFAKKIDLGITKQGIFSTYSSLAKKGLIKTKKSANKLYVWSTLVFTEKELLYHNRFFIEWTKDMTKSNLVLA